MRRRDFLHFAGAAATASSFCPLAARAQQPGRVSHVVYIVGGTESDPVTRASNAAFREALAKSGWADGHNVRIDTRWAMSLEVTQANAAELARSAPDVIVVAGTPRSEVLKRETKTIPIVFVGVSDPVSSGLVSSMARPGGNLTGFVNYEFAMGGKWLQMLKEVAPAIERVLILLDPRNNGQQGFLHVIEAAAPILGVQAIVAHAVSAPEIERDINAFAQEPNGGLLSLPGIRHYDLIAGLATRHRLPAIYANRPFIESGGLMCYDTDLVDLFRRAASYVDRILRGEKPGDLPVQNPTKYELVINLKLAKALGLTVPLPLLASADEVIE